MKSFFILLISSLLVSTVAAQATAIPDPAKKTLLVEASCGMCKLGMKGADCALAVRIDGKSYYVDGANIDAFGDAHGDDGFCNAIRKAQVQGDIVDNRFKASYFKLIAAKAVKKTKKKKVTGR